MLKFKRDVLSKKVSDKVVPHLQQSLVELIDLALQLKQAHWCVVGHQFRTVHLQLDEILVDVRAASDEVAERLATLGVAPDGRASTVASSSGLADCPSSFQGAAETVTMVADALQSVIQGLRESIGAVGDLDPISEDLLIAITRPFEKHLWMVQSQEL